MGTDSPEKIFIQFSDRDDGLKNTIERTGTKIKNLRMIKKLCAEDRLKILFNKKIGGNH